MKLKFDKNSKEETIVTVDGSNFVSQNYIDMVKEIHAGTLVEVEFSEKITQEEQDSINTMIKKLNETNNQDNESIQEYIDDDINPEDIPF